MAAASAADIADTILRSATEGYYPDSEAIAVAPLSTQYLPVILQTLERAKAEVKEEVRRISRENATEVDSWIQQARSLHEDLESTKVQADDIVALANEKKALSASVGDATEQQAFLTREISFTTSLASTLGKLQLLGTTLTQIDLAIARGRLAEAVPILDSASEALAKLQGFEEIVIVGLMRQRCSDLRKLLVKRAEEAWAKCVSVGEAQVVIRQEVQVGGADVGIESVVETLQTLGILKSKVDGFHQALDQLVIVPRLRTTGGIPTIKVDGNTLRIMDNNNNLSAGSMFNDLQKMMEFLHSSLPSTAMGLLQRIIVPNLTNRLINTRLACSVPATLDDLAAFEDLLLETKKFEDVLVSNNWTKERELSEWVDRAPRVWLNKRRQTCLGTARDILAQGVGETQIVEKSETREVDREEAADVAGVSGDADVDWNDKWNDDAEEEDDGQKEPPAREKSPEPEVSLLPEDEDDDDVGDGWGLDEDLHSDEEAPLPTPDQTTAKHTGGPKTTGGVDNENPGTDDADAEDSDVEWDEWGDDITNTEPIKTAPSTMLPNDSKVDPASRARRQSVSKPLTLTETYSITSIPPSILALITTINDEAALLSVPPYSTSSIASAAPDLPSLTSQILALFRALAPLHYTTLGGSMYLYNDTLYLTGLLSSPPYSQSELSSATAKKLTTFAKRVYTTELDAQRTVLLDLLDGAQGFIACTSPTQSGPCDAAILGCVLHLLMLHKTWKPILSTSVLLQSLGSLLNSVSLKLVNDIQDLGDIGETESARLAMYIHRLAEGLEVLFDGRTMVYCKSWAKLRMLGVVLEAGLREIEALWREEQLQGVFEAEEVVELIKALFAESEVRRGVLDGVRSGRWR